MSLAAVSRTLAAAVDRLSFRAPVNHVYNPLVYARAPHEAYLERWGRGRKPVLFVGMNPGPFGMAQTGIPFGDVTMVREFLGIAATVERPSAEHPKRPIDGFACPRREVSGTRLWGWARARFGTPERFFSEIFVVNYCPLAFLDQGGRNLTPDKLPAREQAALFLPCDEALRAIVRLVEPRVVVGVGAFAEGRARAAISQHAPALRIGGILHPSPANPQANRAWAETVERQLRDLGVTL